MKSDFVKLAQRLLGVDDDGNFKRESLAAAQAKLGHIPVKGAMTINRWIALAVQWGANLSLVIPHRITEDAWWGPVTEDAAYRLLGHTFARPDETQAKPSSPRCWTPSDAEMTKAFGQVGTNQVMAALPFPMRLDWNPATTVARASCHREFQKPLTAALEATRDQYGLDRIRALHIDRFGGILNVRKKRGGSTWSAHAWGTAIDLWPSANKLAWKKGRAAFAKPEYQPMREAFAEAGLMSLGKCYDFDWMHFQLNP